MDISRLRADKGSVSRGPDPEIGPLDVLEVMIISPDPAFISGEIADELDVTPEGARHQLENLVEEGLLAKKKPGERTVLYWVTREGHTYFAENAGES